MKIHHVICIKFCLLASLHAQITFSEIMFDPDTDENHDEYVEILNLSQTDSVDLSGYEFSDGQGVDQILPLDENYIIPPGGYALLLDGSYPGNSDSYDSVLASDISVYIISDRAFGSNGLSNSQDECLSLSNTTGDTIAMYCYSTGNQSGFPDEKVLPEEPNTADNWRDGIKRGGTPGRRNSVSPFDIDVGFREPGIILPPFISNEETNHFKILIGNFGLNPPEGEINLEITLTEPFKTVFDSIFFLTGVDLEIQVPVNFWGTPAGEYLMKMVLTCSDDQNPDNNTVHAKIILYRAENELVVNEIKFLTGEGEPEWIELYNYGQERIYLNGWMIADTKDTAVIDTSLYLEPESFLIISEDSLPLSFGVEPHVVVICHDLPVLNNENDEVLLIRPDGSWQEMVPYTEDWLQNEMTFKPSLERIHPRLYSRSARNWGPCVAPERGTPGRANSILATPSSASASIKPSPNPFSPDGDGWEDVTIISGQIPDQSARLKIRVFDICGRVIRTLVENRFTGNRFDVVWDGLDDEGRKVPMGIYIIYAQAIDDLAGVLREMQATVVLAKPL